MSKKTDDVDMLPGLGSISNIPHVARGRSLFVLNGQPSCLRQVILASSENNEYMTYRFFVP